MKTLTTPLAVLLMFMQTAAAYSQQHAPVANNPQNNKPTPAYLPGVIIANVKPAYRLYCKINGIDADALKPVANELGVISIKKRFPQILPPAASVNERGEKLADLSLMYVVNIPEQSDVKNAIKRLLTTGIFEYAEPSYIAQPLYVPNDPSIPKEWFHRKIHAFEAWDCEKGDTNVVVGIVDSGFDVFNPDLSGNIKYNYNDPIDGFDNDSDGYVDNYYGWDATDSGYDVTGHNVYSGTDSINSDIHGGPVASIVCGTADNHLFGAGVGFKCKCLPIKASPDSDFHIITAGYEGIIYAVEHGCQIVNCSWGDTSYSAAEQSIIDYITSTYDVLIVASAGNNSDTTIYYPASYNNVLSVTGTDSNDRHVYEYNSLVDISAPALHIYISGTYFGAYDESPMAWGNGTSDAAPIVSGCAAIVRSHFPAMTMQQVGERLKATADNIDTIPNNAPYIGGMGTGRVNLFSAVDSLCTLVNAPVMTSEPALVLFPNPASNKILLNITAPAENKMSLSLINMEGQLLLTFPQKPLGKGLNQMEIDVSGLAEGIYCFRMLMDNVLVHKNIVIAR